MGNALSRVSNNKIYYYDTKVIVRDKGLHRYLLQFGYSHEKFVPKWIKDLSPRLLEIFLNAFQLGDGHKKTRTYYTSSVQLRDDLQEMIIKTGKASNYSIGSEKGRKGNFGISNYINWRIKNSDSRKTTVVNKRISDGIETYKGKVYSLSVPNHTLLVRRNGKAVFSGNSGYGVTTRNITSRLVQHGYDVVVSAYYGLEPGGVLRIAGVPHLPSKIGKFGSTSCQMHARSLNPDIVLLNCFSEDTEILTEDGWKKGIFLELDDKILTLDKDENIVYRKPESIFISMYNGPMYHLENKFISLAVTPNHELYVKRRGQKKFSSLKPREIYRKRVEFQKGGKWKGTDRKYVEIYDKKYKTNDFLKILGLYISEGNCREGRTFVIHQIKEDGKEIIRNILNSLPFKFKEFKTYFSVTERNLKNFFETLGKNALEKHLPDFVLGFPPKKLEIIWRSLLIGDGWTTKTGTEIYCSSSKKLIDQLQELLLKMGYAGDIRINAPERDMNVTGKTYHAQINWSISKLRKTTPRTIPYMKSKKRWTYYEEWEPYEGLVWCPVMEKVPVYVRRNGKASFQYRTDWWAFPWFPKMPFTSILHSPMDHSNYPEELINLTKEYDYVCAYCHWQQDELLKNGIKSYYTPHGINTKEYFPIPTEEARKTTKFPQDKFIIGRVAANCFDQETEVLTKEGWKKYNELNLEDEYLVLDKDDVMRYYKADELLIQPYDGLMYKLKTKYLDMLVTPTHKLYTKKRKEFRNWKKRGLKKSYTFTGFQEELAKDIIGKRRWYKKNGESWLGEYQEYFILPEYNSIWENSKRKCHQDSVKIRMEIFLKLLGYYIAEGNSNGATVFISQIKHQKLMKDNLELLPFKVKVYKDKLAINNTPLAKWFKENCGTNAFNKRIPREFMNLHKDQLEILWKALYLGDGNRTQSSYAYSTSSWQLAGDIQEILLKMGDYGDIYVKKPPEGNHYAGTQLVIDKNCKDNYIIHRNMKVHEVQNRTSTKSAKNKKLFSEGWVEYKGIIWDVIMPHSPIMVRRHGKIVWSSRSDKEDRKSWAKSFVALRLFLEDHPEAKKDILMYCHANPHDPRGLPLDKFAHKQNLDDIVKFTDPQKSHVRLSTEEMNYLYNSFDILMNPSKREGFGLPIIESLACGKPVIATRFSSMTELVEGRGWLVENALKGDNIIITPINANTAIPDVYGIKDAIEDAFYHPKKIIKFKRKCRDFALDFDWDRIIEKQWIPLLEEIPELEEQKKEQKDKEIKEQFRLIYKKIKAKKK